MSRVTLPATGTWFFRGAGGSSLAWLLPAAIVLPFVPLLSQYFRILWLRPHFGFFPLYLVGIVLLLRRRWPQTAPDNESSCHGASITLAISLFILVAATAITSAWLSAVAAVILVGSFLLQSAGGAGFARLFPVWALLWLLLPPPMVDAWLQRNLQAFTSRRCSEWLDLAHVNHLMAGNVLRIPDVTFFVEEACSGIQSAYWLVAASALFVIAVGRNPFWGCLLLLSSIFWALASNALRVGTVAWTYERMGVDLSSGWRHELLGLVAFSLALTMLAITDRLIALVNSPFVICGEFLEFWLNWIGSLAWIQFFARKIQRLRKPSTPSAAASRRPTTQFCLWQSQFTVAACTCILAWEIGGNLWPSSGVRLSDSVNTVEASILPEKMGEWQRINYVVEERNAVSNLGRFSKTWTYEAEVFQAVFSLDYPFCGYHELSHCYRALGWEVFSQTQEPLMGDGAPCNILEMSTPDGEFGYLIFTLFDDRGQPMTSSKNFGGFWPWALARLGVQSTSYQLQLFVVANDFRLSNEQREVVASHFRDFQQLLHGHLIEQESR